MNRKHLLTFIMIMGPGIAGLPFLIYGITTGKIYSSSTWMAFFIGYMIYLAAAALTATVMGFRDEKKVIQDTNLTPQRMFAESITMAAYYTRHAYISSQDTGDDDTIERVAQARDILIALAEEHGAPPSVTSSYHRLTYSKYSVSFNE